MFASGNRCSYARVHSTVIVREMKKKSRATIDGEGRTEATRDGDSLKKSWDFSGGMPSEQNITKTSFAACRYPANENVRSRTWLVSFMEARFFIFHQLALIFWNEQPWYEEDTRKTERIWPVWSRNGKRFTTLDISWAVKLNFLNSITSLLYETFAKSSPWSCSLRAKRPEIHVGFAKLIVTITLEAT